MKVVQIAKISSGQDGVIWENELFRFDHLGNCSVYNLNDVKKEKIVELKPFAQFSLDKNHLITPHSNSVSWGADYFQKGDEFPLLYTYIYNNKSKIADNLMGACCVYRLQRDGETFKTILVLNANDVLETFDCPFQDYIQGATIYKGKLYSAEGFSNDINKPAIRIIDVNRKVEEAYINLWDNGYNCEPELVDFENDVCYYSDYLGNLYTIEF